MPAVLFVCTGNLCRSPTAAALLRRRIADHGPVQTTVASAGTMQTAGPPPEPLITEAAAYGIDLAPHIPRQVTPEDLHHADLIVGMTREHLRDAVLLDQTVFPRTFTLRELVRRSTDAAPRPADLELPEWLSTLHRGRRHVDLIGESRTDDIEDPMGGPPAAYRRMLSEVAPLVDALHTLLWGAPGST